MRKENDGPWRSALPVYSGWSNLPMGILRRHGLIYCQLRRPVKQNRTYASMTETFTVFDDSGILRLGGDFAGVRV